MDLLNCGIYTARDAAVYIGTQPRKVNGWVFGYKKTASDPIIGSEIDDMDGQKVMSFVNLMEARFIAAFAKQGVSVLAMRRMAEEAKRFLQNPHPFATDLLFKTDGKKIFIEVSRDIGDQALYDLSSANWAMHKIFAESLREGVKFGKDGQALCWYPRKNLTPNVVLNPKHAFGQPVIKDAAVPTRALFDAVKAEGGQTRLVAKWYEITVDQVEEAIRFEMDIARAA